MVTFSKIFKHLDIERLKNLEKLTMSDRFYSDFSLLRTHKNVHFFQHFPQQKMMITALKAPCV